MNKKRALSLLGYAICVVIILAIVMIASAPMLFNKVKNEKMYKNHQEPRTENYERYVSGDNSEVMRELRSVESSLSSRISSLERKQSGSGVADKFVCSVEGTVGSDGQVYPLSDSGSIDVRNQKIVFVCEYRQ